MHKKVSQEKPIVRVVHAMGAAKPGGAETFFVRQMVALHGRTDVAVLPVVRAGGWAAQQLKAAGVPFETAMFGGWWDVFTRRRLQALAVSFKADIVQAWMNRAAGFLPRGKWVNVARLGGYYKLKYYRKNADYLIGNTKDIVGYLVQNGWPKARAAYLPNFAPEPAAGWEKHRAVQRAAWGVPADVTVLLMASRLHMVKGYDVALQALASLPEHVWLVGAGEGPARPELEALAATLGVAHRVRFPGWVGNISDAAAVADIWLLPSRHEPLGNSVLDAWAHGKPLVASRCVGPESLMTDAENGLLVPVDDGEALAAAVARLLKDTHFAAKLAKAGAAEVRQHYAPAVVVDKLVAYYESLLTKDR